MQQAIWADYLMYVAPAIGLVALFSVLIIAAVPVTAAVTRKRILRNRLYLDEHTRKEIAELKSDNERLRRELERVDRRNGKLTAMMREAMCSLTGIEAETKGKR